MPDRHCRAFAPGRVNVIGEHTDYNQGLALPFAIADGVTVRASTTGGDPDQPAWIHALACDLQESDSFPLDEPKDAEGWRAFVHGVVAELGVAGERLLPARLEIHGDVPRGAGLSSSAALTVALCLALLELGREDGVANSMAERIELARLCSRVENRWTGAQTGLLDQLASLFGRNGAALRIDFHTLDIEPVPMDLRGWRFVVVDSGEPHANASSGYNERRAECARACELMGIASLRDVSPDAAAHLPQPLRARVEHVLGENERVELAVAALHAGELGVLGSLLNGSHASLRELYEVSTPAVEATVERMLEARAAGARVMGGGFGGSVLALFEREIPLPLGAREVRPGPGAHLLDR